MNEGALPVPEGIVARSREGRLFDTTTGHPIDERQAAAIVSKLYTAIQSGEIQPEQAASWLSDNYPELGNRAARLEQARIIGSSVEDNGSEAENSRLVSFASQSVGLAIARAEIDQDANSIKAYLDQVVPTLNESLRTQLAESYAQLYMKYHKICDEAPSFEGLLSHLEPMKMVRFSPKVDNNTVIDFIRAILRTSRNTNTDSGFLQSSLIQQGGMSLTFPHSPLLLAVDRLERIDPQIQAVRGKTSIEAAPKEPQRWLLSINIQSEQGVRVETSMPHNVESVVLSTTDGNSVSIPLERLKAAYNSWQQSSATPKIGTAQDIDSLQLKYNIYTGDPSHLVIQGRDVQQNNSEYYVSLTDQALEQILRVLDPKKLEVDVTTDDATEQAPKLKRWAKRLMDRIKAGMLGQLGERDIVRKEVAGFPEPGLHTLKSPDHSNQDRIGFATISYDGYSGVRIVVNDGSGGSLSRSGLGQQDQDQLIGEKAALGRDIVLATNQKPSEALREAHRQIKDENDSYSTIIVADIVRDQQGKAWLKYAGLGDPAIVAYRKDQPFAHRRVDLYDIFVNDDTSEDERKRILGDPSHMQILSMQHNIAVMNKISGLSENPTGSLDSSYEANHIYLSFGDKDRADVHPNDYQINLGDANADFLLILSDGAEPNSMIDSSPQRDMSQALAEVQGDAERQQAIKRQPAYSQEVHSIMQQLTDGKLTIEQASAKIALAARDILGDTDDISVAIIDVRQFRK